MTGRRALALAAVLLAAGGWRAAFTAEAPWPEIPAAERALRQVPFDPDAGAVILLDSREGSIVSKGSDFANVLQYHRRIKILTERGRDAGEVRIPAGKFSRVEAIEARTIRPDGSVAPVPASEIHQRVVARMRGWNEIAHVFHFPAVGPGAILEYRYQRTVDTFVFIEPWSFTQRLPVLVSRVSQAIPGGADYAVLCHKCPEPKPVVTQFRDGQKRGFRQAWEVRDLAAFPDEPLSPPERVIGTNLELVLRFWQGVYWPELGREERFFTDWESVGRFASFGYDWAAKEDASALKAAVAGWVAGLTDPEARLKAVVAGARQATRYVGGDEVYGHSRPVGTLMQDHTADNEERAVLLAAALRFAGFPSRIALVAGRDRGPLHQNFPSLSQFSAAVVIATLPDGTDTWIDPTVTWGTYDFLPWRDSGAAALLLDKRRKNPIVVLPTRDDSGMTRFDVRLVPHAGGRSDLIVDVTLTGEPAVEMREALAPAGEAERRDEVRGWLETLAPPMALTDLTVEGLETVDKPLRLHFTAEMSGLILKTDETIGVRACLFDCYDGRSPISKRRDSPFYIDRGERQIQVVTIAPPEGRTAVTLPSPGDAQGSIGVYSFGCTQQESGEVECLRALTLPRARFPATEAEAIRAFFQSVAERDRSGVLFEAP